MTPGSNRSRRRNPPQVRIDLIEMSAALRPSEIGERQLDELRELLTIERLRVDTGGRLGYRGVPERFALYVEPDKDWEVQDWFVFPRGAADSVARHLERAGFEVERVDHLPDYLQPRPLDPIDADIFPTAVAAARFRSGVVEAHDEADAIAQAEAICRLFPGVPVAFPCRSWERAEWLKRRLSDRLPGEVALASRTRTVTAPYVVGPYASLHAIAGDWEDYMVLCLDRQAVVGESSRWMLSVMLQPANRRRPIQRLFAILPVGELQRMSPVERRYLDLFYGPSIVRILPATVAVVFVGTPTCPRIAAAPGLEFKRAAYWGNDRRNEFVAAVVQAVMDVDRRKLRRYGISPPVDDPTVAIVVESPEHARELLCRLPDWEIRSRSAGEGRPAGHMAIVTEIEAARVGVRVDVLIVASGDAPAVRGFPPEGSHRDEPVLLVDFADDFDPVVREATRRRGAEYRRRGWDLSVTRESPSGRSVERR